MSSRQSDTLCGSEHTTLNSKNDKLLNAPIVTFLAAPAKCDGWADHGSDEGHLGVQRSQRHLQQLLPAPPARQGSLPGQSQPAQTPGHYVTRTQDN